MVTVGVHIRFEAKPDKADDVEALLKRALAQVQQDEPTIVWLGLRLGPTTFAVVDAFDDDAGRQAHLAAYLAPLHQAAADLFTGPPSVEYANVVGAKLPGQQR
jgi:quinol monooxygenase YgiN